MVRNELCTVRIFGSVSCCPAAQAASRSRGRMGDRWGELENIRHAHSPLTYVGWGTPPGLMVLIWRELTGGRSAFSDGGRECAHGGNPLVSTVSLFHPLNPMLLSNSCEYGLRALLYLSAEEGEGYVSLRTISERLDISFAFLGKIFQTLSEEGLTASQRGPSGGVALARDPTTITLYEVVAALDGEDLFTECVLGLPGCGEQEPCPLHQSWARQRDQLELLFRRATLAETAQETKEQNYRLTGSTAGDGLT